MLDYIALLGLWIVWVTFLLNAEPYTPPSPFQNFHSLIHDARPARALRARLGLPSSGPAHGQHEAIALAEPEESHSVARGYLNSPRRVH
jgi:hypothetical protein